MQALDASLLQPIVDAREAHPAIWIAARWLTELGGWKALWPVTFLAAAWLALRGHRRRAASLLIVIIAGRLIVELLKWLTDRSRPQLFDHPVLVHSQSFPSGHAANSTIVYLAIALIAAPLITRKPWPVAAALLLAFAIGLTRPMLGVHWPSDVVAGWALGLAWTLSAVWMLERWMAGRPRPRRSEPL